MSFFGGFFMGKPKDPISFLPPAEAVREALKEARERVGALEFLLDVTEGVEDRLNGGTKQKSDQVREAVTSA